MRSDRFQVVIGIRAFSASGRENTINNRPPSPDLDASDYIIHFHFVIVAKLLRGSVQLFNQIVGRNLAEYSHGRHHFSGRLILRDKHQAGQPHVAFPFQHIQHIFDALTGEFLGNDHHPDMPE
ncbi:hypothetical protein D3C73_947580 [compost metagenome]